jgi:hypothetical protein
MYSHPMPSPPSINDTQVLLVKLMQLPSTIFPSVMPIFQRIGVIAAGRRDLEGGVM